MILFSIIKKCIHIQTSVLVRTSFNSLSRPTLPLARKESNPWRRGRLKQSMRHFPQLKPICLDVACNIQVRRFVVYMYPSVRSMEWASPLDVDPQKRIKEALCADQFFRRVRNRVKNKHKSFAKSCASTPQTRQKFNAVQ